MATRKCPFCKGTGVGEDDSMYSPPWAVRLGQPSPDVIIRGKCLDCEGTGKQHKGWIAGSGSGSQSKPTGSNIRSSSGHYVVY
ncbi:uncharacterized protein METZ01_LOCUS194721 [marine metagenome]|uniref:Uncharacterized protein n=1 Tax=marine metagenome TaxID=408172 RepID=A0A382DWD3_9ZZZZ